MLSTYQKQEEALAQYQSATVLEPGYPNAYRRALGLLLELNATDDLVLDTYR